MPSASSIGEQRARGKRPARAFAGNAVRLTAASACWATHGAIIAAMNAKRHGGLGVGDGLDCDVAGQRVGIAGPLFAQLAPLLDGVAVARDDLYASDRGIGNRACANGNHRGP